MRFKDDEKKQIKTIAKRLESSFESKSLNDKPPLSHREKLDYEDAILYAIYNEEHKKLNELLDKAEKDERYLRALIRIKLNQSKMMITKSKDTYEFELHSTCLSILTKLHNVKMVKKIIEILKQSTLTEEEQSDYIEKEDWKGYTPLIIAVQENYQDLLEYFVSIGANIYHKTKHKKNALMWAAWEGYYDITKYLLENHKFNINAQDDEGSTAFILSIKGEKINTIELLMEHRANPFLVDDRSLMSLDIAHGFFLSNKRNLIHNMIRNYIFTWPEYYILTEYYYADYNDNCINQDTFEKFQEENKEIIEHIEKMTTFAKDCSTSAISNIVLGA